MVSRLTKQDNIFTTKKKNKLINIPVNLRDVYGRVQANKIINWYGFDERSNITEDIAEVAVNTKAETSNNFFQANKIFQYLWKTIDESNCNDIVNIVIPGLRNTYYDNRELLSEAEQILLQTVATRPLPQFENIWNYPSLEGHNKTGNIPEFQLFGSITPYDVVHIPVVHFVDAINKKDPLLIQLYPLNIVINIVYSRSDFWDSGYQRIIDKIDLEDFCQSQGFSK